MNIWVIIHVFGAVIGAGGALMTDYSILGMIKDGKVSKDEYHLLHRMGYLVLAGLALIIFSGWQIFQSDPEGYLASSKFLIKMIIVGVLTVNGVLLHLFALPIIRRSIGKRFFTHKKTAKQIPLLALMGVTSSVSWILALLLGMTPSLPFTLPLLLAMYIALLAVIGFMVLLSLFVMQRQRG